jgi:hypothetical protein
MFTSFSIASTTKIVIFDLVMALESFSTASTAKILIFDLIVALDSTTYNWPCRLVYPNVRDSLPAVIY